MTPQIMKQNSLMFARWTHSAVFDSAFEEIRRKRAFTESNCYRNDRYILSSLKISKFATMLWPT
ncbi:hypothetical protein K432DRAFT_381638 [Lepidopterella palustris CBS 459.81]|uniref:Uncharacterized protein n=1 Tax=Lepidopterella palustris CBS 459.81 TaxID=1314670 RepID=A0A8E2EC17_9PEZI|nr:hypothetical protein K432DRAFT_381638 [Lepidopterella palustris CBS 459.81]